MAEAIMTSTQMLIEYVSCLDEAQLAELIAHLPKLTSLLEE